MAKISPEEIRKIAHISHITISEEEIAVLIQQMADILTYAERVKEIAQEIEEPETRNVNVMREDVATKFDAESILALAPEREENFIVVPMILDQE
jgi:aspartyl-tRNA(Asn)/glutamyl-tRNA(Gln) amidotransferase subunit C